MELIGTTYLEFIYLLQVLSLSVSILLFQIFLHHLQLRLQSSDLIVDNLFLQEKKTIYLGHLENFGTSTHLGIMHNPSPRLHLKGI